MAQAHSVQTVAPLPQRNYTLAWVPIADIVVDPSYQRPISKRKLQWLVRNFDQEHCEVVRLSYRDGRYYCMDGQHRVEAARARDMTLLDAHVYEGLTREEEAALFEAWNTHATTASSRDVFKARLSRGDPDALHIKAIVEECGFKVQTYNHAGGQNQVDQIACPNLLQRIYDDYQPFRDPDNKTFGGARKSGKGEGRLRRVLTVIANTWDDDEDRTKDYIIKGIDLIVNKWGDNVDWPNFCEKVGRIRCRTYIIRAGEDAGLFHQSREKRVAMQMLKEYNRSKRSRRLKLEEGE